MSAIKSAADLKSNSFLRKPLGSKAASPFVGRDEELRRLTLALDHAAEGQGSAIFLTGEPGIGKTRLAREALALAKGRGFRVLQGRGYTMGAGLAYAPFLDALGPLLRSFDPARFAALTDGLPSLGRLFEGLPLPSPEPLNDPALEKTRQFEAISRLLDRLAQEVPVALFIDDVHRCDPASLELLHYLARGLSDWRALVLATYNPLDCTQNVRAMARSLVTDHLAEDLAVTGFDRDTVDKLVRGILGGEPPPNLIDLLDARAAGTPLFVEELIAALIASGNLVRAYPKEQWVLNAEGAKALPQNIRHLILRRLEGLASPDRHVLDFIAILGDATSHAILRTASGLDEESLLDAVRRLRDAGLVADGVNEFEVTHSIAHPLVQEVAYAELSEMERRHAHLKAIEAIESHSEGRPDDLNRLARQYRGAGPEADPGRALAALMAAADKASELYANEEAANHYMAALAIVRRYRKAAGLAGFDETLLPLLLERLGEALNRTGDHGPAVARWNEALGEWERSGNVVAAARVHCHLSRLECCRGHFDIANAHIRASLAALSGREPCQELIDLHYARYEILALTGDAAGVAEMAAELRSDAQRLASPRAEATASIAASVSCLWQGDITNARQHAKHALSVGESLSQGQDLKVCSLAHMALALSGMRLGDHHFTRNHAEKGVSLARRLGAPSVEVILHLCLAHANFMSGAWEESLSCSEEAIALARRIEYPRELAYSLAEKAMTLAYMGDWSESQACISEARAVSSGKPLSDRAVYGLIDIAELPLLLERDQSERALEIAKWIIHPPALSAGGPVGLMTAYIPMGLMLLAEAQVAAGEPKGAIDTARKLCGLGPNGAPYLTALASRAEGLARRALSEPEAAMGCLTRAHEAFASLELPFDSARALLDHATIAAVMQPKAAAAAAMDSLAIFQLLGARRYIDRARRLLRELGFSTVPTRQTRPNGGPLSGRELEIACLIAEGLTTPDIAQRLILSRRTVSSHLSRIYTRLGIGSRSALARYVTEAGLLSPVKN